LSVDWECGLSGYASSSACVCPSSPAPSDHTPRFAFCYSERGLRELEAENAELKKLLAEAHLDVEALKVAFG
jgi:hypothetical protein